MAHCLRSMREAVIDAFANNFAQIVSDRWRYIFAHHIATQGQWQARFALPPLSEIDNLFKTGLRVSELSLMNDQTGVSPAAFDCVENFIKPHDDIIEFPQEKL